VFTQKDVERYGYGVEQKKGFYDEKFKNSEHWRLHYSESRYFPVWRKIPDLLTFHKVKKVFEVGCGPGQLARFLCDCGFAEYMGLDFSSVAITMAEKLCPEYQFSQDDVFSTSLFKSFDYDCCVATEFFEHINNDLDVLNMIRPGTFFLATLPNFPSLAHVRCFDSKHSVVLRYGKYLDGVMVEEFCLSQAKKIFMLSGYRV
jgi:2-polyprenyl-3-methyl-5-hydroxy-6-metoxy-1,4-benzoquinol methylase